MLTPIPETLHLLATGGTLRQDQAEGIFLHLLEGRLNDAQITTLLQHLASRGPTDDELVGAALAMRSRVTPVDPPPGLTLIDTCGTGGAPKTFNISTISAIVIAAAGQTSKRADRGSARIGVAKHGNRSRTRRGSAEVLEAMGVNITASPATQAKCLREIGVCFSFAQSHHQGARHAGAVRKSIGSPTIFNMLGPLANPAGAKRQVIGVWSELAAEKMARALARLNTDHALVAHGLDGMDELTTTSVNRVFTVNAGRVDQSELDTASLGFTRATRASLEVASLDDAVRVFREVLAGTPGPRTDIVLLNAGAGLFVGGAAASIAEGVDSARAALLRGDAERTLQELIRLSHLK